MGESTDRATKVAGDRPMIASIAGGWSPSLHDVVEMMREISRQKDPDQMVRVYGQRAREIAHSDQTVSLSRRGLERPAYRVTRHSKWERRVNPWTQQDLLPLHSGGLFADLLYGDEPVIIPKLDLAADDPAAPYLEGQGSAMFLPMYDGGTALNGVVASRIERGAFAADVLPIMVWTANLFGRATHNLVLRGEVERAYEIVDRELQTVSAIQHSLLPSTLPEIPGVKLAAHYQTSRQAGGDYYDVLPYSGGRWMFLLADVSGHGTPAAVMMAITHAIVHSWPCRCMQPGALLEHVNKTLAAEYTSRNAAFVTAFAAVLDPTERTLTYARAGHNPPRWRHRAEVRPLDAVGSLPLGILAEETFAEATVRLEREDAVVLFTDGITEAFSPTREMFGEGRLDAVVARHHKEPAQLVQEIMRDVRGFTHDAPAADDRTLMVLEMV